jgi:hypothetical protein
VTVEVLGFRDVRVKSETAIGCRRATCDGQDRAADEPG